MSSIAGLQKSRRSLQVPFALPSPPPESTGRPSRKFQVPNQCGRLGVATSNSPTASGNGIHPAARKLLTALAPHAPARFTWGQAATLAGLKPSGGHFNSGRKDLQAAGNVIEANGLVAPTPDGLKAAGEAPSAPSTPAARLALWCGRLPAPAPEMLRTLAAQGKTSWRRY